MYRYLFLTSFGPQVIYLFYFLASLGPQVIYLFLFYLYKIYFKICAQVLPYLWWKKYLTQLQIIQFVVVFIHAVIPLFTECDYPWVSNYIFCRLYSDY